MIKKILKIVSIVILLLVLTLISIPFFFKEQINAKITEVMNSKVDAKISFTKADLNLFKNFPKATITIEKLLIINKAPFEGDTLVSLGKLNLKMSINELFNSKNEAIKVQGIFAENGFINIIFNKDGIGNFDIALKDDKPKEEGAKSEPMLLKIQKYQVDNFKFQYFDESSQVKMVLDSLYHQGKGDFNNTKLDLETKSSAKVSLAMGKMNYMKNISLTLDAVLGIDIAESKYTFKENKALINQLPLAFDGFIQMTKTGQVYDLKFKTPTSSFENFLGLIPAAYASKLEGVKTTGDFTVNGFAKGMLTETSIPKFNIAIAAHNGYFKYPNLPKSVQNIVIDTKIINETGLMKDTYVDLDKLSFKIDQDLFDAKANIKNLSANALVDASFKGVINLANLSQAYPIKKMDQPLSGILKADVKTHFDMASVEKNQYQNIKNSGTLGLTGFNYSDATGKTMNISSALIQFNPNQVFLKQFNAKTGKSDLSVTGVLDNFYGFMFKKQELKGNFNMVSNQLLVSDFMSSNTATATSSETKKSEPMKIPAFLNCSITAKANTVLYDNLVLKSVSGKMVIKDEKATLENVKTSIFGGNIGAKGSISTKGSTPLFDMGLNLNQVDIQQSFSQLAMLKKIAPLAGVVSGKINSTINIEGKLNATELTPDLNSISGDLNGQFSQASINPNGSKILNTLSSNLKFIDTKKINLNDVKIALTFKDGKVNIKPFDVKYENVKATVSGSHSFEQIMDYNVRFNVPAKYLGNEANAFLAKMSASDAAKFENIPVNANIKGSFSDPKVSTDINSVIKSVMAQMAKQQSDKLLKKGVAEIEKLLNNGKKTDANDTQNKSLKEEVKTKATDLINGFFKKRG
ncbi:MAG: AsmA-like C-terminal region-containing protein [Sphingobacteriaceae bacterium]|nr:AsmA-like C-terminal region-containing protein [Sphingobacteriaceae bacterium]